MSRPTSGPDTGGGPGPEPGAGDEPAAGRESGAVHEPGAAPGASDEPAKGGPEVDRPGAGDRDHGAPRSGLRNPRAAVRGLGMVTLLLEALALLLAVVPLRVVAGAQATQAVTAVVVLAVTAVVLAALVRYRAVWYLVSGLQVAVVLCGWFHWSIAVLGVVFGLVWWYVLRVRRTILGGR